ncbi:hypothetical protein LJC58_10340 [Lachnospiraceae bacterium OttesenSCG-928-D06]|nr:hypothetical protein [Lachnospiraceae bacterium OttesenSCG-928-D06]
MKGIFYIGEKDSSSQMNLMLWDGSESKIVGDIKTDNPYVLIQQIDSDEKEKILLEKWDFTEADMEMYGETFSGIYYENY